MFTLSAAWCRQKLDLLWPRHCFVCGQACGADALCHLCAKSLPDFPAEHCPICALPVPDSQVCGQCQRFPAHFDATLAAFAYERPISDMVLSLKSGAGFGLTRWFAEQIMLRGQLPERAKGFDCIVPTPLHARRLRERGFNQSVQIGKVLAKTLDLPLLTHAVSRVIDTPHQMGLGWQARKKNVRGAFACHENLEGARVCVLDDVMTSGSTLGELAKMLKAQGAAHITNVVIARALP